MRRAERLGEFNRLGWWSLEEQAARERAVLKLPRKEVIQPHLPVRLPCYDFVPVTGPALGRGPPEGLAYGLQALPTPMT